MTYRSYKILTPIFYFLFAFIFLLNIYLDEVYWIKQHTVLPIVLFYAGPVLSLCFLYFGIYAYLSRVKTVRKLGGPVTCIICASIFVLCSFGNPISKYYLFHKLVTDSMNSNSLQKLKEKSLDPVKNSFGKTEAKLYYFETGELVEYVDERGNKFLYYPTKSDQEYLQQRELIKKMVISNKRSVVALAGFVVFSFVGFLLFLGYRRNKVSSGKEPGLRFLIY